MADAMREVNARERERHKNAIAKKEAAKRGWEESGKESKKGHGASLKR